MANDARLAELRGLLAEAVPEWVGLCDEEPIGQQHTGRDEAARP